MQTDFDMTTELRLHEALKAAWKYVDRPFTSNSAREEVGEFAQADFMPGKRLPMLFAMQTAWTFVHGAGDKALMAEMRNFLGHGQASRLGASLAPASEPDESPAQGPGL